MFPSCIMSAFQEGSFLLHVTPEANLLFQGSFKLKFTPKPLQFITAGFTSKINWSFGGCVPLMVGKFLQLVTFEKTWNRF